MMQGLFFVFNLEIIKQRFIMVLSSKTGIS